MSYYCAVCKLTVTKVQRPGVQCSGVCRLFFHFDKCAKLTENEIDSVEKNRLQWKCKACKRTRTSLVLARRDSISEDNGIAKSGSSEHMYDKKDEISELQVIINNQETIKNSIESLKEYVEMLVEKLNLDLKEVVESVNLVNGRVELMQSLIKRITIETKIYLKLEIFLNKQNQVFPI